MHMAEVKSQSYLRVNCDFEPEKSFLSGCSGKVPVTLFTARAQILWEAHNRGKARSPPEARTERRTSVLVPPAAEVSQEILKSRAGIAAVPADRSPRFFRHCSGNYFVQLSSPVLYLTSVLC
ncbi:hypothetical protein NDU88_003698 [Pleurodeles waltl]|uniref:Uncharacterized protein n=1 Tax=Pleurodeles waltl TaxID=8319 RepID=A0AAV7RHE9_PLEWA|nr:hypothetical protein NDU88_003698 [Pleurodeles waltl]